MLRKKSDVSGLVPCGTLQVCITTSFKTLPTGICRVGLCHGGTLQIGNGLFFLYFCFSGTREIGL